MSLNDFSICESRDAKFFEHVFHLKKTISTTVYETMLAHDEENMPASSSVVIELIEELAGVKNIEL